MLTITDISKDTINSADEEIVITASASGLQSMQYLEAAFTKQGEFTNYFGLTLNQKGKWYQYKSSPSSSDLSSYFYIFTPVSGTWSGQINAKLDLNDSGFKGVGIYTLKLVKFVTSSSNSINSFNIKVNVTPTPSPSPSPENTASPTNSPSPENTVSATSLPISASKIPTPTSTPEPTVIRNNLFATKSAVLGSSKSPNMVVPKPKNIRINTHTLDRDMLLSKVFIFIGVVFMFTCIVLFVYPIIISKFRKDKLND